MTSRLGDAIRAEERAHADLMAAGEAVRFAHIAENEAVIAWTAARAETQRVRDALGCAEVTR